MRAEIVQKKGAAAAPFFSGRRQLPLLAALLLPALGCFLCHCAYPPLHSWDSDREGLFSVVAAPLPPGTSACLCRRPSPLCELPRRREVCSKKLGVSSFDTPSRQAERLALLSALFLSTLSSLLRHDSSLELGSSADLTTTDRYNRWAERTTLIQDVDYG